MNQSNRTLQYGFRRSFNHLDHSRWSCHWRDRETVDARKGPGGCIVTILLGIAGALVGTWIGRIFMGENYVAGWIMSIVGAMILLLLYRLLFRRGA
jgi:uncharacterized membrane protein YeaQ/YmgE (transglycosylase-associated protein family)